MNIVEFPKPSLHDIPQMLRNIADDIEAGDFGSVQSGVMLLETDQTLHTFGWGDAEGFKAVGMFQTAAQMLSAGLWE
jgi:hypothetical protein